MSARTELKDAWHELMDNFQLSPEAINRMGPLIDEVCDEPDIVADVEEFHVKFGLEYTGLPRVLPPELSEFRRRFMLEECEEYKVSTYQALYWISLPMSEQRNIAIRNRLADAADALVDEIYICLGNAYMHGFNFKKAWRRVHIANMAKVRAMNPAESKRGSACDVVKPPGWTAPCHHDLMTPHAHEASL